MFSLYRRHEDSCRFAQKGVRHINCHCPVWCDGHDLHGKRVRRSLKTRSWSQAQARIDALDRGAPPVPAKDPSPAIAKAVAAYLDDCRARALAPATIVSYENILGHLREAFDGQRVSAVSIDALTRYRAARAIATSSSNKELQALRTFFGFCVARKWAPENPAKALKPPKSDQLPTMPFTEEETARILEACGRIDNPNPREIPRARLRARALVELLLYSGLRISDAIKLERANVDMKTGQLMARMMKTRATLYIRLPPAALIALAAAPHESMYFFWSGNSKLSTAVGSARRTIECVLKLAGITDGHPHRFRDTFSVMLLSQGADLRTVQLLLGHKSTRTTEKHYAPFVVSMQQRLDDAVAKLHFPSAIPAAPSAASIAGDAQARMHPQKDTLGNAKRNILAFARPKRA